MRARRALKKVVVVDEFAAARMRDVDGQVMLVRGSGNLAPRFRELPQRVELDLETPGTIPRLIVFQGLQAPRDRFSFPRMQIERAGAGPVHDGNEVLVLRLERLADHPAQREQVLTLMGADPARSIDRMLCGVDRNRHVISIIGEAQPLLQRGIDGDDGAAAAPFEPYGGR